MADVSDDYKRLFFHNHLQDELPAAFCRSASQPGSKYRGTECRQVSEELCNGSSSENRTSHCIKSDLDATEISDDSQSSPEACSSSADDEDDDLTPEVQQAYRIFHSFLTEKHKALTAPFWHPIGTGEREGNEMSFKTMDNKFVNREYESITEFVADFRLMLENCYRFHGVDHWISKQAQKLEIILEQKLILLSRTLREKTTLAVTSRGRFGTEDEKGPAGTSTRRRSVPRNLAAITVGGCESIMVQALRLEEQQRAKEEKRQRELEKKEAEEVSAKEVEEWERSLLSLAEPWPISTMWELPAIGHFLCLAQTALNLPEIVFFELERCLLMPRCSAFLAKVMTSLLCQPNRRATLHRRPALPYRRWEAELRQKVLGWYEEVGRAEDQVARVEQLGLCHRFFWTLGETSPLEKTAFHLLPFNQRVWLLKGLCDNVYETQKDVQDTVLGQPIHECRESILGYDGEENAYIHFPHFCGADLRIYYQSPCAALGFPLPPFHVKKLQREGSSDISAVTQGGLLKVKEEDGDSSSGDLDPWVNDADSLQEVDASSEESEPDQKRCPKRFLFPHKEELLSPAGIKEEPLKVEPRVKLKDQEYKKEVAEDNSNCERCLKVGETCYKGKSPTNSLSTDTLKPSSQFVLDAAQNNRPPFRDGGPCPKCPTGSDAKPEHHSCFCFKAEADRPSSVFPRQALRSGAETGRVRSKKKKRKKKKEKSLGVKAGTGKLGLEKVRQARVAKSTLRKAATTATLKRKDKRKKRKLVGGKVDSKTTGQKNKAPPQLPVEPTFKLVCTSLDELRDLISRTEDELDELESTKKRCARWYLKRESVKELHITLIRLLNELLPWEPKLLKAFQRNRARLKKESDDFKRHPEYENFIREEGTGTEGDGGACKKGSSAEISRESEDEDKSERALRGDSGVTGYENQLRSDSLGHLIHGPEVLTALTEFGPLTRSSKRRQSSGLDDDFSPSKRGKLVGDDSVIPEPQPEVTSRDQNAARANLLITERESATTVPLGTFQRHCKPIQALLAKSVGNKVTLMSHPQATAMAQALRLPNKTVSAAVPPTEPTASCQLAPQPAPVTTRTQAPITSSAPSNPMQVVYNMSEGLSLVQKDGTPVKFSVQPVVDQKTGEKLMQQVIILPSNLLIQRTEEAITQPPSNTQQSVPTSKAAVVLSSSPVFTVPENKIPVQQVAPLKDTSLVKTPSPAVSPSLQKLTPCRASPGPKKTTEPSSMPNVSLTSPFTHSNKCDAKQELKTVCIRDSQSILVTTRGGNTGVVKVQTSDQSGAGSLPSSPVFTMPPQFQPFFVSRSSAIATSTAQTPHTTTTTKLLPTIASPPLNDEGTSFKSAPQAPLKYVDAVNQSPLVERTTCAVTVNKDSPFPAVSLSDSQTKTAQTLISVNSLFPASSQSNAGVPSTVRAVQGIPQTTTYKGLVQSPLKRCQASSIVPEQPSFQKVFLVAPKTNVPASTTSITTAPAPSAVPGSRVLFMSQSASSCSTVTIPKGSVTSESKFTATTTPLAVDAMKVGPNLAQATGGTTTGTLTKVQGINISGLRARIVGEGTGTSKNLAPRNEAAMKVTPVTMSSVLATSSSGLVFVQKNNSAATSCPPLNFKAPVKLTGSTNGKTVTFSTYGNGHMASSALLSAVDQKRVSSTVSISNILKNRTEPVVTSSTPNLASPSLGSRINKDTTLARSLMADKSWATPSLSMVPSPIKPSVITTAARVSHPLMLNTTATHISGTPPPAPQPGLTSVVRAPVSPIPGTTTVQEKVVINTSAPLAPGTQLLINNMKFVVPAQGLGPGSHVLFISSPAIRPAGPVGTSHVPPVLRGAGTSNHLLATAVVQGPRMVAPGMQSHCVPVKLPAKVGTSVPVHQHSTAVPLVSTDSTVLAQVTPLGTVISSGQQSLTSLVSSQLQKSSPSMATPALLQTGLVSAPPKPHLTSVVSPVKAVISRTSPMVAMPPMSSTVSRMQTLPVATVPPIGGTINSSQATPVATVPPSVNTVIMARCQPVRGVQPGSVRMPVVIANPTQVQGKAPAQVPGGVHPNHTPSKLLLSPDGAVLNVVRCPALQNLPVMANSVTAQVVVTTCSSVTGPVLNTLDSQRILTVNPEGPNH